jgi:hypothetical protein
MLAVLLAAGGLDAGAKSYSSGGGRSYSSHSSSGSHSSSSGSHSSSSRGSSGSSHSSSSGSSHRSSSGSSSRSSGGTSTHSSGGGSTYSSGGGSSHTSTGNSSTQRSSGGSGNSTKSYKSSSGSSYSSGSSSRSSSSDRHSYTSGKSYSSGSGWSFGSGSGSDNSGASSKTYRRSQPAPDNTAPSSFSYDTAAARARQEEVSKANYSEYKRSQAPPVIADNSSPAPAGGTPSYQAKPPPIRPPSRSSYRRTVYVPDEATISTRPVRIYNYYNPYYSRPWVTYNDPYGSLFWWWLLDRSLDDRAYWAYHHRYDMDPARYDALLANDRQLESRVDQLEARQTPRDTAYVPPGIDQDLMYSDQYVSRSFHNRPTPAGVVFFWVLAVPTALAVTAFFIWLIWFKRWQTAA